jgi:cellulose synthase/poly-beta-1,6-N-acetylglucosamine synthase-like glycosyltransferase
MEISFFICVAAVLYPYVVFPAILWASAKLVGSVDYGRTVPHKDVGTEPFTIILAVHNEQARVANKIKETISVLETHPQNTMLVISDHSSDDTVAVASAIAHPQVRVLKSKFGRGKALASNFGVGLATNELLVLTDVETRVPDETVGAMLSALRCDGVGCVNPRIIFSHNQDDQVSAAAGFYWRFEDWLRNVETVLGLYATSSGPCMAIRRSLFRELPPTGDADFTTPLDVIDQGYRCVHLPDCFAYDVMPANARAEFRARTRMVAKNFSGTISRWRLRNVFRHPLYTWAIYSHKILRWSVPFFLLGVFISTAILIGTHPIYDLALALQVAFYAMAAIGWTSYRKQRGWPIVEKAYAFVLANAAFAFGIIKVAAGRVPSYYIPTGHLEG